MGRIRMKQLEGLGNVTVETVIEEFLKNCRLRNLSPKTIQYYEEDLQFFARNIDKVFPPGCGLSHFHVWAYFVSSFLPHPNYSIVPE